MLASSPEDLQTRDQGWRGELSLTLGRRAARTVVTHRRHRGPLQVQRAFHPEGPDPCHVYLLHPPGGVVAGDTLDVQVLVDDAAAALLTTPAATKIYRARARGAPARQQQRFTVGACASFEWLPQETIVYEGADVHLSTRVELAADARFLGWELLCLGRPAAGEGFGRGRCEQRLEVWRQGRPLVLERTRILGGETFATAAWGLRGQAVTGTLVATPAPDVGSLRALTDALPAPDLASVTVVDGALVCRYLGPSAERARGLFTRIWAAVRPEVMGRKAETPRIWLT